MDNQVKKTTVILKYRCAAEDKDWLFVKNCCRSTVNKSFSENIPTDDFKKKILIAEHSPIRILNFTWLWSHIPYWVSTEMSRHKFEKFITSQRDDRNNNIISRSEKRQDSPVDFIGTANMQSLIDVSRKRLCYCASKEARQLMEELKYEMHEKGYEKESNVLVPNCIYRFGCPEMASCGFFKRFIDWVFESSLDDIKKCLKKDTVELTDIEDRYLLYNEYFYQNYAKKENKNGTAADK